MKRFSQCPGIRWSYRKIVRTTTKVPGEDVRKRSLIIGTNSKQIKYLIRAFVITDLYLIDFTAFVVTTRVLPRVCHLRGQEAKARTHIYIGKIMTKCGDVCIRMLVLKSLRKLRATRGNIAESRAEKDILRKPAHIHLSWVGCFCWLYRILTTRLKYAYQKSI